ncbi:MAG: NAD-dependent epimerase/dehydratase family protein [Deltaproteobacteria bacterium]|nr:NAD-dependent epimerase/dehydratase family protein [Deltaproteobacteria bacterium]
MTRTLVTGGTGFLGRHLVEHLLARGESTLRVLTTGPAPRWLEALGAEVVQGSITEPEVATRAVAGVETIYHLAGRVSRSPDDARLMHAIHVDGTRHLCEAAKAARVRRIVLVSTSGTLAVTETGLRIPDESHAAPLELIGRWPYYASKYYQEETAARACEGGPELVTVNPSLLLGPGDDRLSSTQDVLRFLKEEIPVVPSGGMNFVDARDVAPALVAAMERGRPGEKYLLGGPNWTCAEFFGRLARITKVPGPRLKLPDRLTLLGARVMDSLYRHFDRVPPVDYTSVEMATYFWYLDDGRARRELSFTTRDPGETLLDTVSYLRRHLLESDAFSDPPAELPA